jgi:hypothetical protein
MQVTETGPRLCRYGTSAVPTRFTVVSGTGAYGHAQGSGTISLIPGSTGATEQWAGRITLS